MHIREIGTGGVRRIDPADLAAALGRPGSLVWVDIPCQDPDAERVLREVFRFHDQAIVDCSQRNTTPKLHVYSDHTFLVLHTPYLGRGGHVHSIELDLFVGPRYVVTVHGPLNPVLDPGVALRDTGEVADRIDAGRWRPDSTGALLHRIVTSLNRGMNHQLAHLRHEVWDLERQVTSGALGDPEDFLEEMFRVRLGLQAVRTMAALNRGIYDRMALLGSLGRKQHDLVLDSVDQMERVVFSADVQLEYLQGVIDFYQTRINTKMTVAAERLAVIAAITLPATAVSSILGMNVIVSQHTHWWILAVLLVAMGIMSGWLLRWARRQGWW